MTEHAERPRRHKDGRLQWAVHLTEDRQGNCRSCGAPIYWIKTPKGKSLPMSEASAMRDADLPQSMVWMESHFADCEQVDNWRRPK